MTGPFPWLWQQWQPKNMLPLKQSACSNMGVPDFWNATLWLTQNHKRSDPFLFLSSFPSSYICFSFGETKLFTLFILWKHGIPEGFAGSINHWNGCIVITSTHHVRPAFPKENNGHQSYGTSDNMQCCEAQTETLIWNRKANIHIYAAIVYRIL